MEHCMNDVLKHLIVAERIISECKAELLIHGFSKKETEDILKFYVYDKVNKEEHYG